VEIDNKVSWIYYQWQSNEGQDASLRTEMGNPGERGKRHMKNSGGFFGAFWFAGWLFAIAYANLVWWKIILGIVVWPFYLGDAVLAG